MKKLVIYICSFVLILLVILTGCDWDKAQFGKITGEEGNEMEKNCKLVVNGRDITAESYVRIDYEKHYAEIPFIAVVTNLGAEFKWKNSKVAIITLNNKEYILNLNKKSLITNGSTFNIIDLPPGTKHGAFFKKFDDEIVIDSDSIAHFIYLIGARIMVNYDTSIISIEYKY